MRTCAVILSGLLLFTGCGEPRRPKNVPEGSFWVGPRKIGIFVQFGEPAGTGWHVTIYDAHTGGVKVQGIYLLQGFARAEFVKEDFAGWDGRNILLADGGRLVPKP